MKPAAETRRLRGLLYGLVAGGGLAALSWEVLWQNKASLAFGVSELGTALTLAVTMAGMAIGSVAMGYHLSGREIERPGRIYAGLEAVIGLSGLMMPFGFTALEKLDVIVYSAVPALSASSHALGVALLLGAPTIAMGATIPVFQLLAQRYGTSISMLYGLNTAGAACGVMLLSFLVLPTLGIVKTSMAVAAINGLVCAAAYHLPRLDGRRGAVLEVGVPPSEDIAAVGIPPLNFALAQAIVFCTGFVTFGLEVAWFRALRAAFWNTTGTFAIILASVLIPLAVGARLVPLLRRRGIHPVTILTAAGISILLSTPLVERIDVFKNVVDHSVGYFGVLTSWLLLTLTIIGPTMLLLGMALPWCLDEFREAGRSGRLYGLNTLGSVLGSILAGWVLLPSLGFARAAWSFGGLILILAIASRPAGRALTCALGIVSLAIAVGTTSSAGRDRPYGHGVQSASRVLASNEGPDSTVSVIENPNGYRMLMIDGFVAADDNPIGNQYMEWMGRLPALLHPAPETALVICFGTGRTSNSVRLEAAPSLDIVDLNAAVFEFAPFFSINQNVLQDERTVPIVMDGRAWLRRTDRLYDLITLEPMPPNFSGVNALYSIEFYRDAARHLNPGGIAAQWLPFHLVSVAHATAIAATFQAVFPDSILWIDPLAGTGILLGRMGSSETPLGKQWPGLAREVERPLYGNEIRAAMRLTPATMARYAALGEIITDDNQLLAFGRVHSRVSTKVAAANHALLARVADRPPFGISPEKTRVRARLLEEKRKESGSTPGQ
jgi:spermidine synthase